MSSPADGLDTSHLQRDLGRRSLRGGTIAFASQLVRFASQFTATALLARLLTPETFGLVAMAGSIAIVLDMVKEFGLSAATIQRQDISQAQVSTLFWINIAISLMIAAALMLAAPLLASFYGQPELTGITRWLAAGFIASGATVQHWALLRRQMRFGTIALLETSAELTAAAVAIALAWHGVGYWALVVQRLLAAALMLAGSWLLCGWRPGLTLTTAGLRDMLGFGASVTGFGLISVAARSVDQILIGWLWGPVTLGLYERAAKLLLVPVNNLNAPLYAVAMPALSRLQDQPARYRNGFLLVFEKFAMVTMPVAAGAIATADWIVVLLFGPHWAAAAIYVACFAAAAAVLPVTLAAALLYQTQNRSGEMLRAGLADAVVVVGAIGAGLPFGATGIAVAYAVAGPLLRLPVAFWLAGRKGPVSTADLFAGIVPATVAAVATPATIWWLRQTTAFSGLGALAGLLVAIAVGLIVTAAVYLALPRSRRALGTAWRLVRSHAVAAGSG